MKIGIVGTRGIPNQYGGFEQFAEDFAVRMAARGHQVTVYTAHNHPYREETFKGVSIVHCYDPEHRIGTAGQFLYDFNCILDSRKRNFDIILQLGYTSSTVWSWLYPRKPLLVTNMDGLEWKRSKYSRRVQWFLRRAEKWGVRYSDYLIADSKGIRDYIRLKYGAPAVFVAYGAEVYRPQSSSEALLEKYGLVAHEYDLLIARFEPENNMEIVLKAYQSLPERTLVLIGRHEATGFGKKMYEVYGQLPNVIFLGGIYDREQLNRIRYCSALYYHGHSVGGTNPSLLEAMACSTVICAHDNEFNRGVLNEQAFYFSKETDIITCARSFKGKADFKGWISSNLVAIETEYNWEAITNRLEDHFREWLKV